MALDADLAKIAGLNGLTFYVNAYQIHGRQMSAFNILNFATVDSIEAQPGTRLFELWIEQKFNGIGSIRVGQLAAGNLFFVSNISSSLFINGTFGWPVIFAADLPGDGHGYPLTTPGVSLTSNLNDHLALVTGVYNGDAAGAGFTGQEETKNPAGINFRLPDPPLLMAEAQYTYNASPGLAGTLKAGGWYHFGSFQDQHFGLDDRPLADPLSVGVARTHTGDYGVYGVIDQMLWHLPGDDPKKGIGAFARLAFSPPDRNLINLYADAGIDFMGLWEQRPNDKFGLAASFSNVSPDVRQLDVAEAFLTETDKPVLSLTYELVIELTYQAQIAVGWTIQPDFQYIVHPGGGEIDPINPEISRIPNAAVFAIRSQLSF